MKPWPAKDIAELRRLYPTMDTRALARQMQRSYESVKSKASVLGLLKGRHVWTAAEIRAIKKRYPHENTKLIAADLGIELGMVFRKAKRLGLAKTPAYMASPAACRLRRGDEVGKAYRFQKGIVPANKGLRRPGYSPGNMASTQFKKGQMSGAAQHNYVPIGTYRICADGLLERKCTDDPSIFPARRWVGVHRLVWEAAHGPIPSGHVVRFKPGMKSTELAQITPEKLELISLAENLKRNSLYRYPKEIVAAIKVRAALNRKINKITRNAK
jgi:hypothetical protein